MDCIAKANGFGCPQLICTEPCQDGITIDLALIHQPDSHSKGKWSMRHTRAERPTGGRMCIHVQVVPVARQSRKLDNMSFCYCDCWRHDPPPDREIFPAKTHFTGRNNGKTSPPRSANSTRTRSPTLVD